MDIHRWLLQRWTSCFIRTGCPFPQLWLRWCWSRVEARSPRNWVFRTVWRIKLWQPCASKPRRIHNRKRASLNYSPRSWINWKSGVRIWGTNLAKIYDWWAWAKAVGRASWYWAIRLLHHLLFILVHVLLLLVSRSAVLYSTVLLHIWDAGWWLREWEWVKRPYSGKSQWIWVANRRQRQYYGRPPDG